MRGGQRVDTVTAVKPRSVARRVLAGAALVVLTASACTTHAGSAAQVGDETIKTSTLRDVVDRGLAASRSAGATGQADDRTAQAVAPIERGELQRRALTTLVQLNLLEREAHSLGVTVTDQDLDAYYQAYGLLQFGSVAAFEQRAAQSGIARQDLRAAARSNVLELAITDRLTPDVIASEKQARDVYDKIVKQVGKIPLSFAQAQPYLVRWLAEEQRNPVLHTKLREVADREPVSINPRFGSWDSAQLAVVAADVSVATTPAPEPPLGSGISIGQ
ncbi:hypothetical protein FDG2_1151 [Candidatus Protofrankia californiensis]|uniref:SurA domain-containing protein n=1 Tax=Candidatus Protofrankia californiensis TaxID=1839754 RepID=A0A1C3NV60_9ACTN|nr:hypothetical protein FDG2_1151 [Candidatus Protofrankia californiensis]